MSRPATLVRSLALPAIGALGALGFAPVGAWPLTLAGLAVLLALVQTAPTARAAAVRGWLWGFGHFTVNDGWFAHAFDLQDAMPHALGYLAPPALALYLALYPAAAAALAHRARATRPDAAFALAAGAAWIATEWLRATLLTGYAWDPLAAIWVDAPGVPRLLPWIGTYALGGLTVAAAGALLLLARSIAMTRLLPAKPLPGESRGPVPSAGLGPGFRRGGVVLAGLLALAVTDALRPTPIPDPAAPLLHVVQPNIAQDARGDEDTEATLRAQLARSGRPGPRRRLVIWPEGMVRDFIDPGYPPYIYDGRDPRVIRRRIAATLGPRDLVIVGDTPLLFDPTGEVIAATNATTVLDARGRTVGRYNKAHLVPYGEYLPASWLLTPLGLSRLVPGSLDFYAGPGPRTLNLPGFGGIAFQTCYEITFSGQVIDSAMRPRLLVNPSSDAWFGAWGPPQHLAQARLRAMEEGVPVVRATPTGISALIAADGRLLTTIPAGQAGSFTAPLPPALPPTPFARAGNWLALATAVGLAASAVVIRRRRR